MFVCESVLFFLKCDLRCEFASANTKWLSCLGIFYDKRLFIFLFHCTRIAYRTNDWTKKRATTVTNLFYMCTLAPMGLWESFICWLAIFNMCVQKIHRERFSDFAEWLKGICHLCFSILNTLLFYLFVKRLFAFMLADLLACLILSFFSKPVVTFWVV